MTPVPQRDAPMAPFAMEARRTPSQAPPPVEDARLAALRDLTKHLDRLLPSVRQFGWAHPATERTMRTMYDAYVDALRKQPDIFQFTLRPYSFLAFGGTAWEPNAPFDAIPYNLFAAGIRELRFEPGLPYEELRDFLTIAMKDPGQDLPPEDDLVTALWERNLTSVRYECCDAFVEGEAAEREAFLDEADALEDAASDAALARANRLEARAMAITTDKRARAREQRSALTFDEVVRAALESELTLDSEAWTARFVDAFVEGYVNAAMSRDAPLVLASLRKSSADLMVAERAVIILTLFEAVSAQLGQRIPNPDDARKLVAALASAMFGGETFQLLVRLLPRAPELAPRLLAPFSMLSRNELRPALVALRDPLPPPVRNLLNQYVERALPGQEQEVLQVIQGIGSDEAFALMSLLARVGTPAAAQCLAQLQASDDPDLRISARMLTVASPEAAELELSQMLEHPNALHRMSALRTIARYQMRGCFPTLARIVQNAPQGLGMDERLALLHALCTLDLGRGEPLLIEVAKKSSLVPSEDRDNWRLAACQTLGNHSSNRSTAGVLGELAKARWGTSQEIRDAASMAARDISLRLDGGARA